MIFNFYKLYEIEIQIYYLIIFNYRSRKFNKGFLSLNAH